MKRTLSLLLIICLAAGIVPALAYEGEVIKLRASSDAVFTFDPANDAMAKFIVDKFGLEFEDTAYEGDFDKMRLDAMSGTLGDVNYTDLLYAVPQIGEFINQEFFRAIPDDMIEKFPLIKALLERDAVSQAMYKLYGAHYILPKPDSADPTIYLGERKGIFIRKDWLAKVGKEIPTTWEELYEVAKAFTLEDPDGNGVNDTYGLTGDGVGNLRFFFASVGHSNRYWVKQEDGTWIHGALMKDNVPILGWLRKMYDEKLIDPELGSTTWQASLQKFSANQFGMCIRNADADWINNVMVNFYGAANPDINPFDRLTLIPALALDKDTPIRMEGYVSAMCATQFASTLSDEKLERFLTFYEYLLTPEGRMLRMGFEGVDYTVEADGTIKKVRNEQGAAVDLGTKYPSIALTRYPSWGFEMGADPKVEYYDKYNDETKALNDWARSVRNPGAVFPAIGPILVDDTAVTDANGFKFNAEYWAIISGTEPVEKMFDDMVARAMQDGFEEAIEVVNELAQKYSW